MSLFDNAVLMTGYATLQHLFSGADPQRHGNTSPDTCPSGVFQAQDGTFYINCGNDKIFQRLMSQVIDRADLASAEIYATGPDRIRRRDELFAILGEAFAQQPWSHWQPRMRAAGVPCGQVRTVGEAIRSPEAREHELVTRIPHPEVGWVPNVRCRSDIRARRWWIPSPRPRSVSIPRKCCAICLAMTRSAWCGLQKPARLALGISGLNQQGVKHRWLDADLTG